jgi:hypothetical protein
MLLPCPEKNCRRGGVIPAVSLGLVVVLGFVLAWNFLLRSQRQQDVQVERELRSYYIAESGFQWLLGKIRTSDEEKILHDKPSGMKDFFYTEKGGRGFFEFLVSTEPDSKGVQSLRAMIRGHYDPPEGFRARDTSLMITWLDISGEKGERVVSVRQKMSLDFYKIKALLKSQEFETYARKKGNIASADQLLKSFQVLISGKLEEINTQEGTKALSLLSQITSEMDEIFSTARKIKTDTQLIEDRLEQLGEGNQSQVAKFIEGLDPLGIDPAKSLEEAEKILSNANEREIENLLFERFLDGLKRSFTADTKIVLQPADSDGILDLRKPRAVQIKELIGIISALKDLHPREGINTILRLLSSHQPRIIRGKKPVALRAFQKHHLAPLVKNLSQHGKSPAQARSIPINRRLSWDFLNSAPSFEDEFLEDADEFSAFPECAEIGGVLGEDGECTLLMPEDSTLEELAYLCEEEGGALYEIEDEEGITLACEWWDGSMVEYQFLNDGETEPLVITQEPLYIEDDGVTIEGPAPDEIPVEVDGVEPIHIAVEPAEMVPKVDDGDLDSAADISNLVADSVIDSAETQLNASIKDTDNQITATAHDAETHVNSLIPDHDGPTVPEDDWSNTPDPDQKDGDNNPGGTQIADFQMALKDQLLQHKDGPISSNSPRWFDNPFLTSHVSTQTVGFNYRLEQRLGRPLTQNEMVEVANALEQHLKGGDNNLAPSVVEPSADGTFNGLVNNFNDGSTELDHGGTKTHDEADLGPSNSNLNHSLDTGWIPFLEDSPHSSTNFQPSEDTLGLFGANEEPGEAE